MKQAEKGDWVRHKRLGKGEVLSAHRSMSPPHICADYGLSNRSCIHPASEISEIIQRGQIGRLVDALAEAEQEKARLKKLVLALWNELPAVPPDSAEIWKAEPELLKLIGQLTWERLRD